MPQPFIEQEIRDRAEEIVDAGDFDERSEAGSRKPLAPSVVETHTRRQPATRPVLTQNPNAGQRIDAERASGSSPPAIVVLVVVNLDSRHLETLQPGGRSGRSPSAENVDLDARHAIEQLRVNRLQEGADPVQVGAIPEWSGEEQLRPEDGGPQAPRYRRHSGQPGPLDRRAARRPRRKQATMASYFFMSLRLETVFIGR